MKLYVLAISSLLIASVFFLGSRQPEDGFTRFKRILQNTNLTEVYNNILPPSISYPSNITSAQNASLEVHLLVFARNFSNYYSKIPQYWENWRLGRSRMRSSAQIPQDYAPENSEYMLSIYWNSTSLGFVVTGAVFFLIFVAFVIGRFGLGFFGARIERRRKLEKCVKHTPTVAYVFGLVVLFAGIITQMTGTLYYNYLIDQAADNAINQANIMYNDTTKAFNTLQGTTNANLNYTTNYSNGSQTWISSADSANEGVVLTGINTLQNTTQAFSTELRSSKGPVSGALWWFFTLTLALFGPAAFVYHKKIATLSIWFGLFTLLMLGLPWIFAASYFRNQLYVADICQQVNLTLYNLPPAYGTGLSYYINCLSSPQMQSLIQIETEVQMDLVQALDIWRFYANGTAGANPNVVNNISTIINAFNLTTITNFDSFYAYTAPYSNNATLTTWTNTILVPTYNALSTIVDIRDCKYNDQWAQSAQTELCYRGLYYNYVGLAGDLIVFFGFLFCAVGLIIARNVFEKMRVQKETMVSRADLNLEI